MTLRIGWGAALIAVVTFLAIFFAWPVGAMLLRGILDDAGALDLSAFGEALAAPRTWHIVGHTLTMAVLGTAGSVVFGLPAAYILYRTDFPGRTVLRSITLVPFVLPTVVVGVAFRALLGSNGPLGFLGRSNHRRRCGRHGVFQHQSHRPAGGRALADAGPAHG